MRRVKYLGLLLATALAATAAAQKGDDEADDVVAKTPSGAPLKVVVRNDSAVYEKPDRKSNNRPVRKFDFFYVLKPAADAKPGENLRSDFYRVATGLKAKDEAGWLYKDDVVEWPHRQALGLRPAGGRDKALFYESKDALKTAYEPSKAKPPQPISQEPPGAGINLMPILEQFTMKMKGDDVPAYRVAYLHSRSGTSGPGKPGSSDPSKYVPGPEKPEIDPSKTTADIVFVMDTTQSMTPFIEATKEVVSRLAKELPKKYPGIPVRFGLVAYRDVIERPGDEWYVTKVFCNLEEGKDHAEFQQRLAQVKEATQGSEDFPEDVLAGLKDALEQSKWNPNAVKQLILIGDASAQTGAGGRKNRDRLTIPQVLAMAQPRGRENVLEKKVIYTVRVISQDPNDHRVCEEHFRKLAQGEDYQGYYWAFDAGSGGVEAFVKEMVDLISKASGLAESHRAGKPVDVGSLDEKTRGLGLLLQDMRAGEGGPDVPQFASGFACEFDGRGNQVFDPFVLAQRSNLDLFSSALDFMVKALRDAGDPGSRDVQRVLKNLQMMSTHLNLGHPINPDTTPKQLLELILGFPVRNKVFDMSFAKITAMTAADFESWVKEVEASKGIVDGHLKNPRIWFSLGSDTKPEKQHCFLKVKDLP